MSGPVTEAAPGYERLLVNGNRMDPNGGRMTLREVITVLAAGHTTWTEFRPGDGTQYDLTLSYNRDLGTLYMGRWVGLRFIGNVRVSLEDAAHPLHAISNDSEWTPILLSWYARIILRELAKP